MCIRYKVLWAIVTVTSAWGCKQIFLFLRDVKMRSQTNILVALWPQVEVTRKYFVAPWPQNEVTNNYFCFSVTRSQTNILYSSEYSISDNIKLNWSSLTFEKMLQMLRHLRPDTHLLWKWTKQLLACRLDSLWFGRTCQPGKIIHWPLKKCYSCWDTWDLIHTSCRSELSNYWLVI